MQQLKTPPDVLNNKQEHFEAALFYTCTATFGVKFSHKLQLTPFN